MKITILFNVYFIFHCFDNVTGDSIPTEIIKDYFALNKLQNGIIISCHTKSEMVEKFKNLDSLQINIYNPENEVMIDPLFYVNNYFKSALVVDMKCERSMNFLRNVSAMFEYSSVFNYTFHWLLWDHQITNETMSILSNLNINIDAEILNVELDTNVYKIQEIYNTGRFHHGNLIINDRGVWKKGVGFIFDNLQYKYVRRANLTGVILKCMIVITNNIEERFVNYLISPVDTHIDSMNRFNYALLLHVKDIYNFSYEMQRTNSWGYSHNGSFDGMVGQLERGLVDVGGSPIFFRLERAKVVDYTIQTWVSRPCFLFRHPKRESSVFKIYLRPFDSPVWYCSVVVVSLVVTILYFLIMYQNILIKSNEEKSWSSAWLFTLGVIFQQGTQSNLVLTSGKVVIMTILLFSILFYQYYSASIVSSLLLEPPKTIRTLQDLLKSDLKVGVEDILYTVDYFAKTNDPVALKLYEKKISSPSRSNFLQPAKGLAKVKAGGFAFHADIATAYKIIRETFSERQVCELSEIQLFPPQRMMAIVQRGSPYRKLITYGLRKVSESGLMSRQKSLWHEKQPRCVRSAETTQVSIKEFSPALAVLALGAAVALMLLLAEILVMKRSLKKNNETKEKTAFKISKRHLK